MRLKCFLARLARWQEVFAQERTPRRAVALTLGLVCGLGRRTMTRALCFLGWQDRDWATNYRVFSRSPWSSAELFTPVMEAAIRDWLPAHGPIAARGPGAFRRVPRGPAAEKGRRRRRARRLAQGEKDAQPVDALRCLRV